MPGIGGVWQSCLESILPASCPSASLPSRARLWCRYLEKTVKFLSDKGSTPNAICRTGITKYNKRQCANWFGWRTGLTKLYRQKGAKVAKGVGRVLTLPLIQPCYQECQHGCQGCQARLVGTLGTWLPILHDWAAMISRVRPRSRWRACVCVKLTSAMQSISAASPFAAKISVFGKRRSWRL